MPLKIKTAKKKTVQKAVSKKEIVRLAKDQGAPFPDRSSAITIPTLRINQTKLHYEQRKGESGKVEFRFKKGTLLLTLRQRVLMASDFNTCEKKVTLRHESGHIKDNEKILRQMDKKLRADKGFAEILVTPKWYPRSTFNAIQKTIKSRTGEVFKRLTVAAVKARDTKNVYTALVKEMDACRKK